MSFRQATNGHAITRANGNSPRESPRKRPTLPPIRPSSPQDVHHNGSRAESQSPAISASPISRTMASTPFAEPRSIKVHSILNPNNDETASQRSSVGPDSYPLRSTSESPASSHGPLTPGKSLPSMSGHPSPQIPGVRHALPSVLGTRSTGSNNIGPHIPGTIDAKKSPFLTNPGKGPIFAADIGRSTPPPTNKSIYNFQHQNLVKSEDRRGSDASGPIPSQSNSPTTSLTSYGTGPGSRTSPVMHYVQAGPQEQLMKKMANGPQITLGTNPPFSGAPNQAYQLMTIDTSEGPYQIPVDVQAASKVADEKRKRNAGASARFRQRRKEKEREASTTISKLESRVRELGEQRDFYRMERDYFRGVVYNSSAQAHVTPRPASPRQRNASIDSSSAGTNTPEWQQNGERGSDDGRNQRRRISEYYEGQPPPGPTPVQGPPPTSHNPHAQYMSHPTQPSYSYPDPRSQPSNGQEMAPMTNHSGMPVPPHIRAGHYEGIPQGYEPAYYRRL